MNSLIISNIDILKEYINFLGVVISAFSSGVFVLIRAGLLRIDKANDVYAATLMKDIVNGRMISADELFLTRERVAFRYNIHESRMIGPMEGMVFAAVDYLAKDITEEQRKQFQYNLNIYRKVYENRQKKYHRRVKEFLQDWIFAWVFIFLVWMADNHFFLYVELHLIDYIILIAVAAVLALISTLVSWFAIYLRWERGKQQKDKYAQNIISKLCGMK